MVCELLNTRQQLCFCAPMTLGSWGSGALHTPTRLPAGSQGPDFLGVQSSLTMTEDGGLWTRPGLPHPRCSGSSHHPRGASGSLGAAKSQTAQPLRSLRRQEVGSEAGSTGPGAAGSWIQSGVLWIEALWGAVDCGLLWRGAVSGTGRRVHRQGPLSKRGYKIIYLKTFSSGRSDGPCAGGKVTPHPTGGAGPARGRSGWV